MRKLRWQSLLNLTELEFIPEAPKELEVSDEISHSLAWLTGATNQDRRLLRCDLNGALLVGHPWSLLTAVQAMALYPADGVPAASGALDTNKGVLIATSAQLVKVEFYRFSGATAERIYVPPGQYNWFPYATYSVTIKTVPLSGGTASYIGLTMFK